MKFTTPEPPLTFLYSPPVGVFDIPAGCYRAVLESVSRLEAKKQEGTSGLRFMFAIEPKAGTAQRYLAARDYADDDKGRAVLNRELTAFFSQPELDRMLGRPTTIQLSSLTGKPVDVMVGRRTGSGHTPYSEITEVHQAGSLVSPAKSTPKKQRVKARR